MQMTDEIHIHVRGHELFLLLVAHPVVPGIRDDGANTVGRLVGLGTDLGTPLLPARPIYSSIVVVSHRATTTEAVQQYLEIFDNHPNFHHTRRIFENHRKAQASSLIIIPAAHSSPYRATTNNNTKQQQHNLEAPSSNKQASPANQSAKQGNRIMQKILNPSS